MKKTIIALLLITLFFTLTACASVEVKKMNGTYINAFGETIILNNGKATLKTVNHATYKGTYEYNDDDRTYLDIHFTFSSDKNDPYKDYYVGSSSNYKISEDVLIRESSMADDFTYYYKEK